MMRYCHRHRHHHRLPPAGVCSTGESSFTTAVFLFRSANVRHRSSRDATGSFSPSTATTRRQRGSDNPSPASPEKEGSRTSRENPATSSPPLLVATAASPPPSSTDLQVLDSITGRTIIRIAASHHRRAESARETTPSGSASSVAAAPANRDDRRCKRRRRDTKDIDQERERNASDQLQLMAQKQKQTEEEFNRKLAGLSMELSLSNELRQKLDREVRCLQNENDLLEIQQKELKGTINSILESRDSFIKAYEDSTCEMRRAIEARDRKIEVLSEKLKAHSMLFDSIEKEASSIKQIVEDTRNVLSAREEVVAELKSKVDEVSTFEKQFVERINNLESELRNKELELRKRDMAILGLKLQVEAADVKREFQPKIEELQQDLSVKELIIQNLTSENKELHFEVASLGVVMKKIQDALSRMNEEDRKTFTIVLECQEEYVASEKGEALRAEDEVQNGEENLHEKSFVTKDNTTSPEFDEGLKNNSLKEDGMSDSFVSESASLVHQFENCAPSPSGTEAKP